MLLTIWSAEPYPFHRRHLWSNIVLVLGPFIPSPDQIFQGKMVRADHFYWNFGPPDQFFRRTKISMTVHRTHPMRNVCGCNHSSCTVPHQEHTQNMAMEWITTEVNMLEITVHIYNHKQLGLHARSTAVYFAAYIAIDPFVYTIAKLLSWAWDYSLIEV